MQKIQTLCSGFLYIIHPFPHPISTGYKVQIALTNTKQNGLLDYIFESNSRGCSLLQYKSDHSK